MSKPRQNLIKIFMLCLQMIVKTVVIFEIVDCCGLSGRVANITFLNKLYLDFRFVPYAI